MSEIVVLASRNGVRDVDLSRFSSSLMDCSEFGGTVKVRSVPGRCEVKIGATGSHADFFDGVGVFGDRLYLSRDDPPPSDAPGRGNFVLVSSRNNEIHVRTDPLGTYPLFFYQENSLFGFSNNVFVLREALACIGVAVNKANALFGMFVVLGAAPNGMTGFEGIQILQTGETIRIGADNATQINAIPLSDIMYPKRKYADLLEETAEEISSNIRAISGGAFDIVAADLTGGMDSRLVLSVILNKGLKDRFVFRTLNSYPNPDANTAAYLRKLFNLRWAGALRPEREMEVTPFRHMRRFLGRVGGLMEMYFLGALSEAEAESGEMWLSGGLGELMREFWAYRTGSHLGHRTPMRRQLETMVKRSKLIRPHIAEAQQLAVIQRANEFVRDGVQWEHVPDAFYLTSRNNYHFGTNWRASRRRFHPLYSPTAIKAAHALPDEERCANRLGFDLMSRFCPQLIEVPFAEKSWSPLVMPNAPPPITKDSPRLGSRGEERVSQYASTRPKPSRSKMERRLKRDGVKQSSVRSISLMDSIRAECDLNLDPLADVFNTEALKSFLAMPPEVLAQKPHVAALYRVLAAFIWANDLELAGFRNEC